MIFFVLRTGCLFPGSELFATDEHRFTQIRGTSLDLLSVLICVHLWLKIAQQSLNSDDEHHAKAQRRKGEARRGLCAFAPLRESNFRLCIRGNVG
jgi:hypothetical protein